MFILSQSEFILRLALSFCPKFWLHPRSTRLQGVYHIVSLTTEKLNRLETNLNQEYQIFYSFGLKLVVNEKASSLPSSSLKYVDIYTGVHSSVLRLQAMLFQARAVEKTIESHSGNSETDSQDGQFLDELGNSVSKIYEQVDALHGCLSDAIVQVNKLKFRPVIQDRVIVPEFNERESQTTVVNQDDYQVEDEVFELYCKATDNYENEDKDEVLFMSQEEKAKREIEKQSAARMVKELKVVLVNKADEWKEREAIAMRKKKGNVDSIQEEEEEEGEGEERTRLNKNDFDDHKHDSSLPKVDGTTGLILHLPKTLTLENSSSERWLDEISANKVSQVHKSITESALRLKFLPYQAEEEEFCGSGENSESEDDTVE